MKAVAVELGPHGVRANAVLPGPVMSEMIDNDVSRPRFTGGPGTTSEDLAAATRNWVVLRGEGAVATTRIADAVTWLASEESARVTGIEIPVDGGHLILRGMTDAYGLTR